ncbi:DUF2059 domain-containing protein [Undibacterium sp. JH2W]|uniref:DUF2059 domain-containing protein n=1 Tax=Undibacterium sp. JH2W TaxID=3413037 RepID=UPI003BF2603D
MYKTEQFMISLCLLSGMAGSALAAGSDSAATAQATRVINASGVVRMIKATSQPAKFPCIDKTWKKSEAEVQGLYVANFTSEELRAVADFYETPLGVKYITAFETQAYNRNHPAQVKAVATFSDVEQNEIKQFYETRAGKKYMSGPEAQIMTDATMRIGFDIAVACFKAK